jgi:hypothetical protein
MLNKEQVIQELSKFDILGEGRIVFKVLDYSENRFAPEKVAYRVHYSNYLGQRRKVTYYPNSVGFQWS